MGGEIENIQSLSVITVAYSVIHLVMRVSLTLIRCLSIFVAEQKNFPWGTASSMTYLVNPRTLQAMWNSAGHAKGTTSALNQGRFLTEGVEETARDTGSQHSYQITRTWIFIFLSSKQQRG